MTQIQTAATAPTGDASTAARELYDHAFDPYTPAFPAAAIDEAIRVLPFSRLSDRRLLVGWTFLAAVASELKEHRLPSILIHGPRGTGKTTLATTMAALACNGARYFELEGKRLPGFLTKIIRTVDTPLLLVNLELPTILDPELKPLCLSFGLVQAAFRRFPDELLDTPRTAALGETLRRRMLDLMPDVQRASDDLAGEYLQTVCEPHLGQSYAVLMAGWFVGLFGRAPDATERQLIIRSTSLV